MKFRNAAPYIAPFIALLFIVGFLFGLFAMISKVVNESTVAVYELKCVGSNASFEQDVLKPYANHNFLCYQELNKSVTENKLWVIKKVCVSSTAMACIYEETSRRIKLKDVVNGTKEL